MSNTERLFIPATCDTARKGSIASNKAVMKNLSFKAISG